MLLSLSLLSAPIEVETFLGVMFGERETKHDAQKMFLLLLAPKEV
jgi:hypothetical protein